MALQETKESESDGRESATRAWGLLWTAASLLLLSGCTADSYRRSADKQANGIVREYQAQVLKQTNAFSIDTAITGRKPAEISPAELIDDRRQTNQRALTVEAAIDLAVKDSPTYQKYKEDLFTAALNLSNERHKYGPQPSASGTGAWSRNANGSASESLSSSLGAGQAWLLQTGGKLTVNVLNNFVTSDMPQYGNCSTRLCAIRISQGRSGRPSDSRSARSKCR